MSHWLFLPDDAIHDLAILASLPPAKMKMLRDFLDANEFRPRYNFYVKVAELLDVSDEAAAKLSTFINYVQSQRVRLGKPGASVPGELEYFLTRASREEGVRVESARLAAYVKANKKLLAELFADHPKHDHAEKVRGLETGPLPHLHSFRTVCDLRPIYNADADEIVTYLPVVTLSLITHCSISDETKEIVVQLAEGDLAEIQEQFVRLEKKLALLKQRHPTVATDPEKGGD